MQSYFADVFEGTFAYVSNRQEVYVKTNAGWRRVALEHPLPTPGIESRVDISPPSPTPTVASVASTTTQSTTPTTTSTTTQQLPPSQSSNSIHLIALNYPISGRMRGIGGADTYCFNQARSAGFNGTYRAFLSSRDQHLLSVIRVQDRSNVPVVNAKGEVLFDSWNAMFDGKGAKIDPNKIYSFQGKRVYSSARWPMKILWHGSNSYGKLNRMHNCASWYTSHAVVTGQASLLSEGRLLGETAYSCTHSFILLCFENSPRTLRYKKR